MKPGNTALTLMLNLSIDKKKIRFTPKLLKPRQEFKLPLYMVFTIFSTKTYFPISLAIDFVSPITPAFDAA